MEWDIKGNEIRFEKELNQEESFRRYIDETTKG